MSDRDGLPLLVHDLAGELGVRDVDLDGGQVLPLGWLDLHGLQKERELLRLRLDLGNPEPLLREDAAETPMVVGIEPEPPPILPAQPEGGGED